MSDMRRLGLNWDEYPGINNQSGRTALYDGAFELLRQKGLLYPCYCSRNQRLAASAPHESYAHDRSVCRCKTLSASERRTLEIAVELGEISLVVYALSWNVSVSRGARLE